MNKNAKDIERYKRANRMVKERVKERKNRMWKVKCKEMDNMIWAHDQQKYGIF